MSLFAISAAASVIRALAPSATSYVSAATRRASVDSDTSNLAPSSVSTTSQVKDQKASFTRESLAADTANFSAELMQQFQQAGIQTPPAPVISVGTDNQIKVSNQHPDRAKIEKLFEDQPTLAQSFRNVAQNTTTQRASDQQAKGAGRDAAPMVFQMAMTARGAENFFSPRTSIAA